MDEFEPDLIIKGLSLWIVGRAYPNADNLWDADANRCRAVATATGARIELEGIISSASLHFFAQGLGDLYDRLEGVAGLDGSDLGLTIEIKPTSLGHMTILMSMSPDYDSQSHGFEFDCDQTDLKPIASQCRAILARYPVMIRLPN